jgi:hypothetical protein
MMGCFEKLARPWDVTKHGIDPDWNQIKVSWQILLNLILGSFVKIF